MVQKRSIVLIEAPESKVTYERDGQERVCSAVRSHYPKQSLLMVAAYLRDYFDVSIVDMKIDDVDHEELMKEYDYGHGRMRVYAKGRQLSSLEKQVESADVIGITSNFTRSAGVVASIIRALKQKHPSKKIVVGGVDVTFRAKYYLEAGADLCALGDIDYAFGETLLALIDGKNPAASSGIAFQGSGGVTVLPAVRSSRYRTPIDQMPFPAYDLIGEKLHQYNEPPEGPLPCDVSAPYAFFITSKGCYHACPFCSVPQLHGKYRYMSSERVERELKYLKLLGIQTLVLMEDNLLSRLDSEEGYATIKELFRLLRFHGFAWEFGNGLEIGKLLDHRGKVREELLDCLFYNEVIDGRRVGAYRLYVPLETLEESPDHVFEKLKSYDEEVRVIEAIASRNLPMLSFGIILGRPDSEHEHFTYAERRCLEIRQVVEKYGVDAYFTPFIHTLLPGTIDYQTYENFLVYPMWSHPELYHFHVAAMRTQAMQPDEIVNRKMNLEDVINGADSARRWRTSGKYAFSKHRWEGAR